MGLWYGALSLFTKREYDLPLKDKEVSGTFKEIFTGEEKSFTFDRQVEMSAWGYKLYEKIHVKD